MPTNTSTAISPNVVAASERRARVGHLVARRRRELAVDPVARARAEEVQDRRHDQERLQEVADHPAAPDAEAARGVEAARVVPEQHRERRGDRRDQAHQEVAAQVARAPQVRADVERDHRAPEDQQLERAGEREEQRAPGRQAAHQGAREVGGVGGHEPPGRPEPDRGQEAHHERRVDGDRHLERPEPQRQRVPVLRHVEDAGDRRDRQQRERDERDAPHAGASRDLGEPRQVPPGGTLVLVVDRGQALGVLFGHRLAWRGHP